jgi:hypothetical protein
MRRRARPFIAALALALALASPGFAHDGHPDHHHVVGDAIADTPLENERLMDAAISEQHGGTGGHLAASSENVALVGSLTVSGATGVNKPDHIADVAVSRNHAYLAARRLNTTPCGPGGFYTVDISNPSSPTEVSFTAFPPESFPGEGMQALDLNTSAFRGTVLLTNNENCTGATNPGRVGGMSIYDISNPAAIVPLAIGKGDTNNGALPRARQIHSVFGWEANRRAFAIIVDNEELTDVDILEITNPAAPVMIAEVSLANWPDAQSPLANGNQAFLHDMVVRKVQGHWYALLSYWDAGWIVLNVDNPAAPVFVDDSDYAAVDPLTGISPPEGNGHQAEWSHNAKWIIGTDEDFAPYRLVPKIVSGPFANTVFTAIPARGIPQVTPDDPMIGPSVFVGQACTASPPPAAPSADAIAVVERGTCTFQEKATNVGNAGYQGGVVFNNAGPVANQCDALVNMAITTSDVPMLFVARSTGYQILGITGYNPANCPSGGANPALPAPGTAGSNLDIQSIFDGWGYVQLVDARTLDIVDSYAIPEALDPDFAEGFGNLTVHEVATDKEQDLGYLSYYNAGLRVIRFDASGITEVGHFIDAGGNDFWGVEAHRLPDDPSEATYVLASDRDAGLWIFQYTGP